MATNDRYDRQLRLWGAAGQRALGETTIVLINATASGTETLKNLGKLGRAIRRSSRIYLPVHVGASTHTHIHHQY
jgi:hypothetical protein